MRQSLIFLLPALLLFSCEKGRGQAKISTAEESYVILISFDGFRYDYIEKQETPNFDKFIKEGIAATMMIPSYPSKTFPNHYSIVTGLYPGNHGLVDNSFYDPDRKSYYRINDRSKVEDGYYYGGMPLWQLAQAQGMKSASYFWVGSESKIAGSFPDYYYKYDGSVSNEARIEKVLEWLELPSEERPRFVSLYFSFLDDAGHNKGPDSDEIKEGLNVADLLLGQLMAGLETSPLNVNVIIVSDHGMYPMTNAPETFIFFDELVDLNSKDFITVNSGTHAHIYSPDHNLEKVDSLYNLLLIDTERGYSVYKKENLPDKWHYNNPRTGDLLIVSDPGKHLSSSKRDLSTWEENWGNHGFDPYATHEMGAIFYAHGPDIVSGLTIDAFENIHVYPLIARILGLSLPDVDGRREVLESVYIGTE